MIVQKHREFKKDPKDGCFAVGKSEEGIFTDLKNYAKRYPNDCIYYFVHPIRPSKENYRPEYMMEITHRDDGCLMVLWDRYQ